MAGLVLPQYDLTQAHRAACAAMHVEPHEDVFILSPADKWYHLFYIMPKSAMRDVPPDLRWVAWYSKRLHTVNADEGLLLRSAGFLT